MPRILSKLRIDEVSSVDRGAGLGVRVMLMKRAGAPYDLTGIEALPTSVIAYLKRDYSDDQRKEMAASGEAMPDGGFPIKNKADLHDAVQAFGRAKNKPAAKKHIIERARALGATDELPEGWKVSKGWVRKLLESTGLVKQDFNGAQADIEAGEYAQGMMEEIAEAVGALQTAICSIQCDPAVTDKDAAIKESIAQFQAHIQGVVPEGIENAMRGAALAAAGYTINDQGAITKRTDPMTDEEQKAQAKALEDTQKALDLAKREIVVLKMSDKHKGYMKDRGDDMGDDEKGKFLAMSPDERDAHMEKHPVKKAELPAEVQKALDENTKLRKRLDDLESANALISFQKRAGEIGIGEANGETLLKAYAGDKAAIDKLLDLVKASTTQAKEAGLFKEFGSAHDDGSNTSAYGQLVAKAAELRKADPKLTDAQAFAKVYADPANVELAKRERLENRPAAA